MDMVRSLFLAGHFVRTLATWTVLVPLVLISATVALQEHQVSIIEHFANPPLVANCTRTSLNCKLSPGMDASQVVVYWTFRGENASKLSDIEFQMDSRNNEWRLVLSCPTLEFSGTYSCNAHHLNHSQLVSSKEAVVQVYVPVSIQPFPNSGMLHKKLGLKANLRCRVTSFPKTIITWHRLQNKPGSKSLEVVNIDPDDRLAIESKQLSETLTESSLSFTNVYKADEGARNAYNNQSESRLKLTVLDAPKVKIDRIEALNSRTLVIKWSLESDGNSPLKKVTLFTRNLSDGHDWSEKEASAMSTSPERQRPNGTSGSFIVPALSPATNYSFKLMASNEVGSGESAIENFTTLADVPSQISEIHVLGKTNETLLIGWKRPAMDNGSSITQYQMELRNMKEELVSDQMMEVESQSSGKIRSNHMYIFVNLSPATRYSFRVRPCSLIGCSNWTAGFGVTQDGWPEPPRNVRVTCFESSSKSGSESRTFSIRIWWQPPIDPKGTIIGYNISLSGQSMFRNEYNEIILDNMIEERSVGPEVTEWTQPIKPNTNYTARVCTSNKSGCGSMSQVTIDSSCQSEPTTPAMVEPLSVVLVEAEDGSARRLKASIKRLSERNGLIKCYKVVMVRLPPKVESKEALEKIRTLLNSRVNITSYDAVHPDLRSPDQKSATLPQLPAGYVAEEFPAENIVSEVFPVIGDSRFSTCHHQTQLTQLPEQQQTIDDEPQTDRIPRRVQNLTSDNSSTLIHFATPTPISSHVFPTPKQYVSNRSPVPVTYDGPLAPSTNYTGYLEVQVIGSSGKVLTKSSELFTPILTGPVMVPHLNHKTPFAPILSSMGDSANAIAFGIVSGLALVLLLLMFVLCFLTRKVSEGASSDVASSEDLEDHGFGEVYNAPKSSSARNTAATHCLDGTNMDPGPDFSDKWISDPVNIQDLPPLTYMVDSSQQMVNELPPFPMGLEVPQEFMGDLEELPDPPSIGNNSQMSTVSSPDTHEDRYADVHL